MRFFKRFSPASLLASTLLAASVSACAPHLDSLLHIKPASNYATAQSLSAPVTPWPTQQWWLAYNDTQLNALMEEALQGTPSLAVAQARLQQAQGQAQAAGATLLPTVTANASYTSTRQSYNNGAPAAFVPQGWNDSANATLEMNYELDFWGRNRAQLAAATSKLEAARAEAAQAQVTLTTGIAAAYADLAQQYQDRDAAADAVRVRTQTAKLFAQRQANGLENIGSVKQAQALQAEAEGQVAALNEAIGLTRNRIAALLGKGPDRGLALTHPSIDLAHPFGLPANLPLQLIGHRPDVQAARLRVEAAAQQVKMAKTAFYPNINLSAYIGRQVLGLKYLGNPDSTTGGIGPAVNLPIFNRGALTGAYKSAAGAYNEAVANYDSILTHALQDVANVVVSHRALAEQLNHARAAVNASTQAWQVATGRYKAGLSNYLEVLTAEDRLIGDRRTLADLQARAFTLDIGLMRALGGGYAPQAEAAATALAATAPSTTIVKE